MSAPRLAAADIEFARIADARALTLDLYLPEQGARPPLLIWIHGGAWLRGDKTQPPVLPFLTQEFALASIQYHFSSEARFPRQIHTCKAAVRWLRAQAGRYGYDGDRIGALGASAGGHLAALLGASNGCAALEGDVGPQRGASSAVQAVVDLFGPTDFLRMLDFDCAIDHAGPDSPEGRLLGGAVADRPEAAAAANPIRYISPRTCPFLILHGQADDVIPWQQSQLLATALQDRGIRVEFHALPDAGHGGPIFTRNEWARVILDFLRRTLR